MTINAAHPKGPPQDSHKINKELSHVLVFEDDLVSANLIGDILGVTPFCFDQCKTIFEKTEVFDPIGIFLDVYLANNEIGIESIPSLKKHWPNAPIIVITSDHDSKIIEQALSAGAHDFIQKPLRPREVQARLMIRRNELQKQNSMNSLTFGDLTLNLDQCCLSGPKSKRFLSKKEASIIKYLFKNFNAIVSKDYLKGRIWEDLKVTDNALNRKLYEVRKAISETSRDIEFKSIYGKGIQLQRKTIQDDQLILDDLKVILEKSNSSPL